MPSDKKHTAKRKPSKCPACGSKRMADILFGYPAFGSELKRKLELGEVVLGGCIVTACDPMWECADCHIQVYKTGTPEWGNGNSE